MTSPDQQNKVQYICAPTYKPDNYIRNTRAHMIACDANAPRERYFCPQIPNTFLQQLLPAPTGQDKDIKRSYIPNELFEKYKNIHDFELGSRSLGIFCC